MTWRVLTWEQPWAVISETRNFMIWDITIIWTP